ncbi:chemotaxis protein CheW [Massilia sp. ST3]|uniref:chemotaxis protein CheW n=1 Tax=Massilia sp. ST3 TaxID=2824903 RepID=UPI001B81B5BF|nr:chemotaxis protein CheW [Massilia sp. ST3]
MTDPRASRVYAPVRCLRFAALGADLAAESVHIGGVIRISAMHAVTRHEPGHVMLHEGNLIPLADYRGPESRQCPMAGAPALIATVYRRKFALVVDRIEGRLDVECAEIAPPADALACRFPYLTGRISRGQADIYLIDVERLLGPTIEKHLLKRR